MSISVERIDKVVDTVLPYLFSGQIPLHWFSGKIHLVSEENKEIEVHLKGPELRLLTPVRDYSLPIEEQLEYEMILELAQDKLIKRLRE